MKKHAKKALSVGRAYLVEKLHAKGFPRRMATHLVNVILDSMREGLRDDHEVEFPLGKLKLLPHRHRTQEGKFLGKKRTIYRRRSTVVHEMDEKGKRLLNPSLPKPKRRIVLPPKPWEKDAGENMISLKNRTMRGVRKSDLSPQTVSMPGKRLKKQALAKIKLVYPNLKLRSMLPPPPGGWPTGPIIVNMDPSLGPVGLPIRPGVKKRAGK